LTAQPPEARVKRPLLTLIVPVLATLAIAASTAAAPPATNVAPAKADARVEIARRLEVKVEDVRPSPIAGLYEIRSGAEIGYVSTDGRFYVDGDVFDMTSKQNLTEPRRQEGRLSVLSAIDDKDAIVFSPAGTVKHSLTVFTDVDCTYCRRMHQEIAEFNRLGFRIRYVMYPAGGVGSVAWRKAEAVLCSPDRRDALTRAKRGESVDAPKCNTQIVAHHALGESLGINGTPGIITDQGEYLAGYLPAASMAEYLKQSATAAAAKN
jgi:thiol:disulfide interchange protein DsbC